MIFQHVLQFLQKQYGPTDWQTKQRIYPHIEMQKPQIDYSKQQTNKKNKKSVLKTSIVMNKVEFQHRKVWVAVFKASGYVFPKNCNFAGPVD